MREDDKTRGRRQRMSEPARAAWRSLADLVVYRRNYWLWVAHDLGLRPTQAKALMSLEAADPQPMRTLAEVLHCDPSVVTNAVNRLEELGLVERRRLADDRRVKHLVLTAAGKRVRQKVEEALYEPPEQWLDLDDEEIAMLARIVTKVTANPVSRL